MRVIKFRAWDKERKEMREVKFMDWSDWWVSTGSTWERGNPLEYGERNSFKNEETDRHILMQYTGINDVEGNELYDGDITEDEFGRKSLIYWDDKLARFVFQEHKKKTKYYLAIEHLKVKKIGNRWDNPELLGG